MSTTGPEVVSNVRTIIHDTVEDDPVVDNETLRDAVNRQVSMVAQELGMNPYWINSAFTTNATDYDYQLPTGVEYHQVLNLVYDYDKYPLSQASREEVLVMRAGIMGTNGRQFIYALDARPDGSVYVMFGGKPGTTEAVNVYVSAMPAVWPAGPDTPPTIYFSQAAARALELRVAADVVSSLGPADMVALAINPQSPNQWLDMARSIIRQERIRIAGFKRAKLYSNQSRFWLWGR